MQALLSCGITWYYF